MTKRLIFWLFARCAQTPNVQLNYSAVFSVELRNGNMPHGGKMPRKLQRAVFIVLHDFFLLRKLTFADSRLWSCFTLTISFYQLKALSFYKYNLTNLSGNWHIQIKVTHSLLDWDDHTAKVDVLFTSPRQWQQVQDSFLTVGDRSASRLSPFQEKILWCLISKLYRNAMYL